MWESMPAAEPLSMLLLLTVEWYIEAFPVGGPETLLLRGEFLAKGFLEESER